MKNIKGYLLERIQKIPYAKRYILTNFLVIFFLWMAFAAIVIARGDCYTEAIICNFCVPDLLMQFGMVTMAYIVVGFILSGCLLWHGLSAFKVLALYCPMAWFIFGLHLVSISAFPFLTRSSSVPI